MEQQLIRGTIFDIQGFSVHDGPGCRTLIFMKGCTLNCHWCANPEGLHSYPEPLWHQRKCNFDFNCARNCPSQAITFTGRQMEINRSLCAKCKYHTCANACMTGALNIAGYEISVEELYHKISRDRNFWGPDGGITLTGGEPFVQPDFTKRLLEMCYTSWIHTAVETCGNTTWESLEGALPFLDWIFFDLKHLEQKKLETLTGTENCFGRIISNAAKLTEVFKGRLVFRMPLIAGFNDQKENIEAAILFLKETGANEINILPGHHLGREKFASLGLPYYTDDLRVPSPASMVSIREAFLQAGITCYIGSDTPF